MSGLRRLLFALALVCIPSWAQPGPDFGMDRKYREDFDRFITEGQYAEAEAFARAALARAEAANGESLETALALDLLTEFYYYSDRVLEPAAEACALRAIAVKQKLFGPDDPRVALSLRLMGNLMQQRADYTRAREFHERAVRILRKTAGQEPRQEAYALGDLGSALAKTGDLIQARSTVEEALAIRQRYFPPNTLNTAVQTVDYAVLLRDLGDYTGSEANFRRALAVFEKKLGPDHLISTSCTNELGALFNLTGRVNEAVPLLERTLAIEEKAYGPDHVDLAFVLNNLAAARGALGDWKTARAHYERALAIAVNVFGADHPEVARILSGYATALWRLGERPLALKAALRTEEIGRAHVALTIRALPERQALLYASRRARGLDVAMEIALSEPATRRSVLDAVIRSRALVFDEMASRRRAVMGARDPEVSRLSNGLFAARERLSRLVMQGPRNFRGNQYTASLDRARIENDLAGRALAERSASFRTEGAREAAGLDQVASMLRPDDALVSFVRYGSDPSYAAFVQRGGREAPVMVRLGAAKTIDGLVQALRQQVQAEADAPGVSPRRSEALYREAGSSLRRQVWDPMERALAGAGRIFLTPDHALNLVDFGALPARGSGYLAEHGPVLHYLSSERDMVLEPAGKSGAGLLAMGSPSFDGGLPTVAGNRLRGNRSTCVDMASMHFDPLPASAMEIREIGALWRKAGEGAVLERTGDAANTLAFRSSAPGKKVLHVAAHAFFAGEGCAAAKNAVVGESPLLLSGIALAGANRSDGGILTAEEIAAIDLEGVEWAVLSGCATGDGKLLPGEGVFGLRRAFRVAGARTVIMSMWPVDDGATRTWMTALYREHFAGAKSAAESVRAAGLTVLAERRARGLSTHPFYWAGFIAAGDSR